MSGEDMTKPGALVDASAEYGEYFLDRAFDHLRYHEMELKGADLMTAALTLAGLMASIHRGFLQTAPGEDAKAEIIAAIAAARADREED